MLFQLFGFGGNYKILFQFTVKNALHSLLSVKFLCVQILCLTWFQNCIWAVVAAPAEI